MHKYIIVDGIDMPNIRRNGLDLEGVRVYETIDSVASAIGKDIQLQHGKRIIKFNSNDTTAGTDARLQPKQILTIGKFDENFCLSCIQRS